MEHEHTYKVAALIALLQAMMMLAGRGAEEGVAVRIEPADIYARVPFHFSGIQTDPQTRKLISGRNEQDGMAVLFPNCGEPIRLVFAVTYTGEPKPVRLTGSVTDYHGKELQKIAVTVSPKGDEPAMQLLEITPAETHCGPFYLNGHWEEAGGRQQSDFSIALGQANRRAIIEDFEQVQYAEPGAPLESSAQARHRGALGLTVRLNERHRDQRRRPKDPKRRVRDVPLPLDLPERPVRVGAWIKPSADVNLRMQLRDPGVEINQGQRYDNWSIGPLAVPAGDWRYVELPMPGYSRPEAERHPYCEANGVVDYPLTLEYLEIEGDAGSEVFLDDLEVWTQGAREGSLRLRAGFDKPTDLLYPNDTLNLVVANQWLWGQEPAHVKLEARLADIRQRSLPIFERSVRVAPGQELVEPVTVKDLPVGGYRFLAQARDAETNGVLGTVESRLLVYQPSGGPLNHAEFLKLLSDRDRLLVDLGLNRDLVIVPWHSVDGSPSVEPQMGLWSFDWIAPALAARRKAGLEILGRLGFTPLWADPTATWNQAMRTWYGSTTGKPTRTVYWEEYVLRTAERFREVVSTWVVWDRPDGGELGATPQEFAEDMLEVAARAVREVNPNGRLISGGIARENIEEYLVGLAEADVSKYLDGIGILPTTAPLAPEDGYLGVTLSRAQRIRRQERLRPELWALGLAWPTGEGQYRVDEFDQAAYIARAYAICRAHGVEQIHVQAYGDGPDQRRDSASLIYRDGERWGLKPAALAMKAIRTMIGEAEFVQEVSLNDRRHGLARAYLFRRRRAGERDELVLVVWRREGQSSLPLPAVPTAICDVFGNPRPVQAGARGPEVELRPDPQYILFQNLEVADVARRLARTYLRYEDAAESAWKASFTFHLDVGESSDEAAAQYAVTQARHVGPVDSYYHNDYGRHVIDAGHQFRGEERLRVPVATFGDADLLLRRRVDYSVADQRVKVYCNGDYVGQWFTYKRDPKYRWRDTEFIIPNRFFAGQTAAEIRLVAQECEATSYYYWAGPLRTKTLYVSDLSLLVATSGYGPGVDRDRNILGGPIKFFRGAGDQGAGPVYDKGLGTNAAGSLADSLVVVGLNKQYRRFRATVGVDAATGGRGSVRFRIHDGIRMLYDSKDMTYYSEPQEIDLDVSEAIILMLWVDDSGDGNRDDLANWAGARLELK